MKFEILGLEFWIGTLIWSGILKSFQVKKLFAIILPLLLFSCNSKKETPEATLNTNNQQDSANIASVPHTENIASRRVMEKIGMRYIDDRFQYECLQAYYEIRVEDHKKT